MGDGSAGKYCLAAPGHELGPHKKLGVLAFACNPHTEEMEKEGPRGLTG